MLYDINGYVCDEKCTRDDWYVFDVCDDDLWKYLNHFKRQRIDFRSDAIVRMERSMEI